jgi:hypothetical protein
MNRFSGIMIIFCALFASCDGQETYTLDGIDDPSCAVSVSAHYPAAGAADVAVSDSITAAFGSDMNAASFTSSTVSVVRASDSSAVSCTYSYSSATKTLTIKPVFQFGYITNDIAWTGLKPGNVYTVTLSGSGITTAAGSALGTSISWSFTTADLDYGFYFLGSDGKMEKYVDGRANSYFDSSRPTVIWIHGWEKDTTANDYYRECAFFFNNQYVPQQNTIGAWRTAGWNVCVFYWGQFSDESEVKDAEAKIWAAENGRQGMRYRCADGTYKSYLNNTINVTDMAYAIYVKMFSGYAKEIRVLGHSLGNQLATTLCKTVSDKISAGTIASSYMPARLALLDPFWGKNAASYLSNQWTGAVCRTYVTTMLARNGLAVEQYKSSLLGGLIGDENLGMRSLDHCVRIWDDFIPNLTGAASQHAYSNAWYTASISGARSGGTGYYIGAAATNAQIKAQSNWSYSSNVSNATAYFWYQTSGKSTAAVTDDAFTKASGTSSW